MIMRAPHKKLDHGLSSVCSSVFGLFGALAALLTLKFTIHALTGTLLVTNILPSQEIKESFTLNKYLRAMNCIIGYTRQEYGTSRKNVLTVRAIFVTGFFSLFIGFFAVFTGQMTHRLDHEQTPALALKNCHVIAGLVSYVAGSICFATGVSKEAFTDWVPFDSMPTLLLLFVFITTVAVIAVPCQKCINKDYDYS